MAKRKQPKKTKTPALLPPVTWREKYWRPLVTATEVTFAAGFWGTGISVTDYVISAILLSLGLTVALVGVWAESRLKLRGQVLSSIVAIAIFVLGGGIVFVRHDAATGPSPSAVEAQVKELQSLQAFLNGGLEDRLRVTFDYQNMLVLNINVQIARMHWYAAGNTGPFPYPQPSILHVTKENIGTMHTPIFPGESTGPNGVNVREGPKDIFIQPQTQQHSIAMAQLDTFLTSPLIPGAIKPPLRALKKTVSDNDIRMRDILQARLKQDDRYYTEAYNENSKFGSVISNQFYSQFLPLAPNASQAIEQIQKYLRTN